MPRTWTTCHEPVISSRDPVSSAGAESSVASEIALVGPQGVEPWTVGLKVRCSTTELWARAESMSWGLPQKHHAGRFRIAGPAAAGLTFVFSSPTFRPAV